MSRDSEQTLIDLWSSEDYAKTAPPYRVVYALFSIAVKKWRFFLADFAAEVAQHEVEIEGMSPDDTGPLPLANPMKRKALLSLETKLLSSRLAIQATRSDLSYYRDTCYKSREFFGEGMLEDHERLAVAFENLIRDLDIDLLRTEHVQAKLRAITSIVASFLELHNGYILQRLGEESRRENQTMRLLNQDMRDMAKTNAQDSAKITVLTILTLVYLPLTVVSNFFSTSFVGISPSSDSIYVTDDWWLLLVTTLPLTVVTLYVWKVWSDFKADKLYPPWWPKRFRKTEAVPRHPLMTVHAPHAVRTDTFGSADYTTLP
ncbi:uncharacterized protein AB675_595 [Cyphellophora attinorum]|uniref:Magnesium transport protein CorA n=1 Tax=Cyphellophora attinorum TaxID=1664694 RepID=A0A0N1HHE4_9EURO|nr:uncharacterized protein AB675_595 [Phialophora attinorum]KPI45390.1 hypothetical protein AB675_595 [Phialophora attinorum]